ncbi:hypothetical protein B0H16DRAFT_1729034 [Mycena metata]|uniref:RING-type domain-containing protein n=1 Tax=Mycena metata TaxID=1033252 RepID=A0AAD7IDJ1_9AGAR|nr:hypothetical protein B0H16DRAFT_1729034 [Mycena metata]
MSALSKIRPEKDAGTLAVDARGHLVQTGTVFRGIMGGPPSLINRTTPAPSRLPPLDAAAMARIATMPTRDSHGRRLSTRDRSRLGRVQPLLSGSGGSISAPRTPPRPGSSRAPIEILSSPGSPGVIISGFRRGPSKAVAKRAGAISVGARRVKPVPSSRAGVRVPQNPPVAPENLWLTAVRPPTLVSATGHTYQMCGLCYEVKAHPVSYKCGHSHCYVCVRMWLEESWNCPEPTCGETMHEAPFRHEAEECALLAAFPGWCSKTQVSYSWAGLTFPKGQVKVSGV